MAWTGWTSSRGMWKEPSCASWPPPPNPSPGGPPTRLSSSIPSRPPDPPNNFVVEPNITFRIEVRARTGPAGSRLYVPLEVQNRTRWWLSGAFTYHPVMLSYHWVDNTGQVVVQDGRRTAFPRPLGP